MAGTLVVGTLSDGATPYDLSKLVPTTAKAWVNFDASGTVLSGYNVSSVTDLGVGNHRVNYSTPFLDTNYCPVNTHNIAVTNATWAARISHVTEKTPTSTTIRSVAQGSGGTNVDYPEMAVIVFG